MDNSEYLDILKLVSRRENGFWFKNKIRPSLCWKFLMVKILIINGKNILFGMLFVILKFLKLKNLALTNYYAKTVLNYFFNTKKDDLVLLFGRPFYYKPGGEMEPYEEFASFVSLIILISEVVIRDQYCIKEFIKDNFTIIDAGSQIGEFSLYANHLNPSSNIYSFEPSKGVFEILQKNTDGVGKIKIFNCALGEENKKIKLLVGNKNSMYGEDAIENSDIVKNKINKFLNSEEVQMITIDSFVEEHKIEKVDFIKMDTEGYERNIIMGAAETIRRFSPVIVCSAYHLKDDKIKIPELIKSINPEYKYRIEKRGEEDLVFWK